MPDIKPFLTVGLKCPKCSEKTSFQIRDEEGESRVYCETCGTNVGDVESIRQAASDLGRKKAREMVKLRLSKGLK